jgi:RNA polymerase sigma-70 factor (ECF subfamily)
MTWIASIARYRALDVIRRQNVRLEGNRVAWASEETFDLPHPSNVEDEVESSQRGQRVRVAMARLPEAQQQVLAYAYFQGYSHSEIAEILNEPLGTVKTRIRLAMEKLRQVLIDEGTADG